jgi:hypothetical protein
MPVKADGVPSFTEGDCPNVHVDRRRISARRDAIEGVVEGLPTGAAGICDVCALFRSLTVHYQASKLAWK